MDFRKSGIQFFYQHITSFPNQHIIFMIVCQKAAFDLEPGIAYLNGAYMSPQLQKVTEAGWKALQKKQRPYQLAIDDFFEPVRDLQQAFAELINLADWERIAVIPSVSYGLANVAANLPFNTGQKIVLVEGQFPSNVYPWKRLAEQNGGHLQMVQVPEGLDKTSRLNQALLDAIDENTAAVAIGTVHWADGTVYDLPAIRAKTRAMNAWMILDGTQSVGALPFDVQEIQPEALICAGYKWLMGPYGIGVAYYSEALDGGTPIEENWINRHNSEDFRGLVHYQYRYQPKARRFSVGEQSNMILVPMLTSALNQLNEWGIANMQSYCKGLTRQPLNILSDMGYLVEQETNRAGHLFGIRLPQFASIEKLQQALLDRKIFVSLRGDAVRVSPNIYNEAKDLDLLVDAFSAAII